MKHPTDREFSVWSEDQQNAYKDGFLPITFPYKMPKQQQMLDNAACNRSEFHAREVVRIGFGRVALPLLPLLCDSGLNH